MLIFMASYTLIKVTCYILDLMTFMLMEVFDRTKFNTKNEII